VLDASLGGTGVQFIFRRKTILAALAGFVEVLIVVVSRVIQDIQRWPFVLAHDVHSLVMLLKAFRKHGHVDCILSLAGVTSETPDREGDGERAGDQCEDPGSFSVKRLAEMKRKRRQTYVAQNKSVPVVGSA
jgi:hypothetical protein